MGVVVVELLKVVRPVRTVRAEVPDAGESSKVSTTSPLSKAAFGKTGPSSDWSSGAWYLSHRLQCADVTSSETHKKWQAPHRSARFSCDFFLAMFTALVVRARGSAAVSGWATPVCSRLHC